MNNELIFVMHSALIGLTSLGALYLGQCALITFIAMQCLLANLFIVKQTTLFGFTATCADAFTIGAVLGLNLLQEYFGKKSTYKAIWISFFFLVFYAIVSQVHLLYIPSSVDTANVHYQALLMFMPRIVVASFSVYLLVQHLDAWLYGFFKKAFNDRYLVARNYGSIAITQLVDTVLFSFAGLHGIVDSVIDIIFISYSVKLIAIALETPFIALSKKLHPTEQSSLRK